MSTDLSNCSKKGQDGQAWYHYSGDDPTNKNFKDNVGFITECQGRSNPYRCRDPKKYEPLGYLKKEQGFHWLQPEGSTSIQESIKCMGSGTNIENVGGCVTGEHIVCAKRPKKFEMLDKNNKDGWITCCNRSKSKDSPKGGCHPDFYLGSNECQNACFNDSSLIKNIRKNYYLSNYDFNSKTIINKTYKNNVCNNAIKNGNYNNISSKLLNFCSSKIAYDPSTNKPTPYFSKICGCHYPKKYYEAQLKKLKTRFPNILKGQWGNRECYSELCVNSDIKQTDSFRPGGNSRCPSNNLQSCIGDAKLEANNIDISDTGKIEVQNIINCVQNVDGSTTTNTNNSKSNSNSDSNSNSNSNEVTFKSIKTITLENIVPVIIISVILLIMVVGAIIYSLN